VQSRRATMEWHQVHPELLVLRALLRREDLANLVVPQLDLMPDLRMHAFENLLHFHGVRVEDLLHLSVLLRREVELAIEPVENARGDHVHRLAACTRTVVHHPDVIAEDADGGAAEERDQQDDRGDELSRHRKSLLPWRSRSDSK